MGYFIGKNLIFIGDCWGGFVYLLLKFEIFNVLFVKLIFIIELEVELMVVYFNLWYWKIIMCDVFIVVVK